MKAYLPIHQPGKCSHSHTWLAEWRCSITWNEKFLDYPKPEMTSIICFLIFEHISRAFTMCPMMIVSKPLWRILFQSNSYRFMTLRLFHTLVQICFFSNNGSCADSENQNVKNCLITTQLNQVGACDLFFLAFC
jgi:hypothetical protein